MRNRIKDILEEGDTAIFNNHSEYKGAVGIVKEVIDYGQDRDYVVLIEGNEDIMDNWTTAWETEVDYIDPDDFCTNEDPLDKQAFQPGDVVNTPDGIQVVREAVIIKTEECMKYMYETVSFLNDTVNRYDASSLEYQYHDVTWKEYFTKCIQNSLPAWRGEIYNTVIFEHYRRSDDVMLEHDYSDYYNYTLRPDIMEYISEEYTIYGRIYAVLALKKNAAEIEKILSIKPKELRDIRRAVIDKINNRNISEIDPNFKKEINNRRKFKFTDLELSVASEIDKRDVIFGQQRTHFPVDMTNSQIMESIKEAYDNAHKIANRKIIKSYIMKHVLYDEVEPVNGSTLYEGYSQKYKLTIQFLYNFDLDGIETAYPVEFHDVNSKKKGKE